MSRRRIEFDETALGAEIRRREAAGEPKLKPGDGVIVTPPRGFEYEAEITDTMYVGLFNKTLEKPKVRVSPVTLATTSGRKPSYRPRWVSARQVRLIKPVKEGPK